MTTYVNFSPDGQFGISEEFSWFMFKGPLRIWNLETGKEIFNAPLAHHSSVVFSRNGRYLAFGGNEKGNILFLWDIYDDREFMRFEGHTDSIEAVAFSPDGNYIISGSSDKTMKVWDIGSGRLIRTLEGLNDSIANIDFSPDGQFIVSSSRDGNIKVWNFLNGRVVNEFKEDAYQGNMSFSPDGNYIYNHEVFLNFLSVWNIKTGRKAELFQKRNNIKSIAFSPDGNQIITGDEDGVVRYLDSATWDERAQFISFRNGEWIVLNQDGYYNASEKGDEYLNVRIGNQIFDVDQYREQFYRPDLVTIALSGEK